MLGNVSLHRSALKDQATFIFNDDGTIRQYNAWRCAHGNHIIIEAPNIKWDFCMRCMAKICLHCAASMSVTGECEAFEKALLRQEGFLPPIDRDKAMKLTALEDSRDAQRLRQVYGWR